MIGFWLVFVCQAIGEIATLLPLPGAFNAWGGRVFDEAMSFQMTWMYFINWALTIPAELSASAVIISFWIPEHSNFPVWIVPLLIIVAMVAINLAGVKVYGELEYWFSILKASLVLDLKQANDSCSLTKANFLFRSVLDPHHHHVHSVWHFG